MARSDWVCVVFCSLLCVSFAARSNTFTRNQGHIFLNHVMENTHAVSAVHCNTKCMDLDPACQAVNYKPSTNECQICDENPSSSSGDVVASVQWNLYSKQVKCEDHWVPSGASCYMLSPVSKSFNDATSDCQDRDAVLVEIGDVTENAFISTLAASTGFSRIWLGLNDIAIEGSFVWPSGSPVGYTNLGYGEGGSAGEDCFIMVTFYGTWHDVLCIQSESFICEKGGL